MPEIKNPLRIALVFACLVMAATAQNTSFELTYSTSNTSTLILTHPNLDVKDHDAASYRYDKDPSGAISGATADLFSDRTNTGNDRNINGLSAISGSSSYYVSTSTSSVWGTVIYAPDDIVLFNPVAGVSNSFWKGSNHSSGGFNIDGIHVNADGSFLFSTTTTETIYGLTIRSGDIALVNSSHTGATLYFNQDLLGVAANIDAITVEKNTGNLVFSTSTSKTLGGVSFDNGDLVMWDGSNASIVFRES